MTDKYILDEVSEVTPELMEQLERRITEPRDKSIIIISTDEHEAVPTESSNPRPRVGRPYVDRKWLPNTKTVYFQLGQDFDVYDSETGVVVYATCYDGGDKGAERRAVRFARRHNLKVLGYHA